MAYCSVSHKGQSNVDVWLAFESLVAHSIACIPVALCEFYENVWACVTRDTWLTALLVLLWLSVNSTKMFGHVCST